MFENLINELENLSLGQEIEIRMPLDENGYYDRKCPNKDCGTSFKLDFEDWKNIVKDEVVYCPICRHEEPATEWNTEEQFEYIKTIGLNHLKSKIGDAIKKDANSFNRKQKPGLITMSLSYKPGNEVIPIPPAVVKELEQNYKCNKCACRYSFLGSAYFCPACGNENVDGNLIEWIRNIENFIMKYSKIKKSLSDVLSNEDLEKYITQLLEEHYCKIVSIFQVFSEKLFNAFKGSERIKIRKNLFQNLDESSIKWKELTNQSYEDIIKEDKYNSIKEHFQIRHLLMHTSGVVDEGFLKKVNCSKYKVGMRVIITKEKLEEFIGLAKELMDLMVENWKS